VLLYGLEACPISNKLFKSLDFVGLLNGCFRKNCLLIFNCMSMQECVAKRRPKCKFLANYVKSNNLLCQNIAAVQMK